MRRWGLLVGIVGLVGLGFFFWPSSEVPAAAGPVDATATGEREGSAAPTASPRPRGGRVVGLVVREGLPVDRARVTLRASAPLVSITREDGRFLFDDVPLGPLYLSASNDEGASEVTGPFEVAPGESIGDVVLVLSPPVRVEGVVIDLVSRAPVTGATVATTHQVSRTDASGRFTLSGARGPTWLDVVAPGFLPRAEWVSLELARSGGRLELVLTPACRLRGRVTEWGAPVSGATVWAELLEGASQGTRSTTVFTGRDGDFLVEGPSGLLRLWAVTPRGTRIPGPLLRLAVGEAREGIELNAPEVSAVDGVVTRDGQPLPFAALTAIDASSEAVAGVVTSGPDGHFTFTSLLNGRYVVQVRAGALVSMAGPFEHRGDGQGWLVAVVGGATLEGRVEPRQSGVRVRWRSGAWPGPVAETVTDVRGQFRFEGLPDELVAVDAEGPGGSATSRARPGDDVVLRLGRGQVVVRMRDDLGQPVTDAVLLARSLETGAVQRQLVLAPDGVTKLGLSEGRWELTLEASGRGRSSTASLQVGSSPVEVELSLERSVSVRGLVRDAATHLPIAGAQVDAVSGGPLSPSRLSVVSDARGEFFLTATPRSARLSVRHPLYQWQSRAAGDGDRWEVALVRAAHETPSAPAFQFEGVGLVLDGSSGAILVSAVNEGGPAERAGIQKGDAIVSVDGAPIAGLSMEQVVGRIRGPAGTPVVLALQRGGQQLVLTVRRRLLAL
jgi:hypothetical protein